MAWTTKTSSGRWKARYRSSDGRTRSRTFDRKSDAERWLRAELGRRDRGEWVDPAMSKTTVADWLPRWKSTRGNLAASTLAMQDGLLRNHVEPWFADWPLGAVTPTDMHAFIADLGAKGLSASTVRHCYSIAKRVFDTATDAGLIVRTPARGITLPRLPDQEMRFLTRDEVTALAAAANGYSALVLTAAYTGARFGELAALQTDRLDLLRRRLTVAYTLSDVRGELSLKAPKTAASRRRIALPRFLCDVLGAHLGSRPAGDEGFVFQAPLGGPLRRSNFRRRVWLPAVRDSVGEPMRFHDLRHTHVALLIDQGEHPKTIQVRLGHASISTTLGTYGHVFEGLDEAAADRLDAAVAPSARPESSGTVVQFAPSMSENPR
jgi:integrase